MRLNQPFIFLVFLGSFIGTTPDLPGQGIPASVPALGQTKADLVSAAFSAYIAGDIPRARQFLLRASQLDVEDVTVRRLIQNLTPSEPVAAPPVLSNPATPTVAAPPVLSIPAPTVVAPPTTPLSASEQARIIALQNGLTLPPVNPTAVPSLPSIPALPQVQPAPSGGKLDFAGFQESVVASLPPVTPTIPLPSVSPVFPPGLTSTPDPLAGLGGASPSVSSQSAAPAPLTSTAPMADLSTITQQLSVKREQIDNLTSQISTANIALLRAQQSGDAVQVQTREAELAGLRSQLRIVDAEVVQLQERLANPAEVKPMGSNLTPGNKSRAAGSELIQNGETIELFVMQDESFNGMYQVRQGGYVLIPRVGRVQVASMTIPAAEANVAKAFSQTMIVNPTIIIERPDSNVEEDSGGVIYLMGEFKRPGSFKMVRGRVPTILNTIIQSGGESPVADLSRVRLMRLVNGSNLVEEINVNEILKGGGLANDLILRDGDILHLPAKVVESATTSGGDFGGLRGLQQMEDPARPSQGRDNGVFVTGRVKGPGFLALPEDVGVSAYSAILSKGGFAPFANPKKVYVVREVGGGQKVHIPVNIRNVQLGLESDVELKARDIVVVPEKFFSL